MINQAEEYCAEFALDALDNSANSQKKIWIYKEDLQVVYFVLKLYNFLAFLTNKAKL